MDNRTSGKDITDDDIIKVSIVSFLLPPDSLSWLAPSGLQEFEINWSILFFCCYEIVFSCVEYVEFLEYKSLLSQQIPEIPFTEHLLILYWTLAAGVSSLDLHLLGRFYLYLFGYDSELFW